ncbi:hypothetical protein AHAS_Ahas01G0061300 [Arachis hypogaea]
MPKEAEDMRLKRLSVMNDLFLLNLRWKMLTDQETLWVKMLRSKYGRNNDLIHYIKACSTDSSLLKELTKLQERFGEHVSISVGNSRNTYFWKDQWLKGVRCLMNELNTNIEDIEMDLKVVQVVNEVGE